MDTPNIIPVTESGMELEERSLIWKIENLPAVLINDALIKAQRVEFTAGAKIGHLSRWSVYLVPHMMNGKKKIGIFYKLEEKIVTNNWKGCSSQMTFLVLKKEKGETGSLAWEKTTKIKPDSELSGSGRGFTDMLDVSVDAKPPPEHLEIHLRLKLYAPARTICSLRSTLDEFLLNFTAKAKKDLNGLVENPVTGDIKLVSSDGKEFSMPKGVLTARSPVFEAMLLRSEGMAEATEGIIRLPDMTSKTLKVFLTFIYSGDLHPDWNKADVLAELTNAAAKYELKDLLQLMNVMVARFCDLENVVPLLTLATQLQLKTATEELLKFVREKGAGSPENFFQILKLHSVAVVSNSSPTI